MQASRSNLISSRWPGIALGKIGDSLSSGINQHFHSTFSILQFEFYVNVRGMHVTRRVPSTLLHLNVNIPLVLLAYVVHNSLCFWQDNSDLQIKGIKSKLKRFLFSSQSWILIRSTYFVSIAMTLSMSTV